MKFLVGTSGEGEEMVIQSVELVQFTGDWESDPDIGSFIVTLNDNDPNANKLLNDFSKVKARASGSSLSLTFDDAEEEPRAREIDISEWKERCRHALTRVTNTVSMYNL